MSDYRDVSGDPYAIPPNRLEAGEPTMGSPLADQVAQAIWRMYAADTGHALPAGEADRLAHAAINTLQRSGHHVAHQCVGQPGHYGVCCCDCSYCWEDPKHGMKDDAEPEEKPTMSSRGILKPMTEKKPEQQQTPEKEDGNQTQRGDSGLGQKPTSEGQKRTRAADSPYAQ